MGIFATLPDSFSGFEVGYLVVFFFDPLDSSSFKPSQRLLLRVKHAHVSLPLESISAIFGGDKKSVVRWESGARSTKNGN